jgi:hypothetical protein
MRLAATVETTSWHLMYQDINRTGVQVKRDLFS